MTGDEVACVVPTDRGEVKTTIAAATLRTFAGRSHVTMGELLERRTRSAPFAEEL